MKNHSSKTSHKTLLKAQCRPYISSSFRLASRIHRFSTYDTENVCCYVKREDELSFGISGSKLRKYASLLPYLQKNPSKEIAIVGSPFSNHVLSLAQLLNEAHLRYVLFLQGPSPSKKMGNYFFLSMLCDFDKIHWLDHIPLRLEPAWISQMEQMHGCSLEWIPMGGSMQPSFPGSLSLAIDIVRNEEEIGLSFDHIFIDSGTGMTSASVVLGLHYLQRPALVHVVQVAGKKEDFYEQLKINHYYLEELVHEKVSFPSNYEVLFPSHAKCFGQINTQTIREMISIARKEGILLDPVYNAKLFSTGKTSIQNHNVAGNILFIQSGGGLALTGFQEQINRYLNRP